LRSVRFASTYEKSTLRSRTLARLVAGAFLSLKIERIFNFRIAEAPREAAEKNFFDVFRRHFRAELFFHRRHLRPRKPARDDAAEIIQIGAHVERKPMVSNAAPDGDADRGDFFIADPDARPRWTPLRSDAEMRERPDRGAFEVAQIAVDVLSELRFQIDDRIDDELSRAVIGHVAAAARAQHGNIPGGERVGFVAAAAE